MRTRRPEPALGAGGALVLVLGLVTGRAAAQPAPTARPAVFGDRPHDPRALLRPEAEGRRLERRGREGGLRARGFTFAVVRRPERDLRPPPRDAERLPHLPRAAGAPARARVGDGRPADRAGLRRLRREGRRPRKLRGARGPSDRRPHPLGRRALLRRRPRQLPRSLLRFRGPGRLRGQRDVAAAGRGATDRPDRPHARRGRRRARVEERAHLPARRQGLGLRAALGDERGNGARRRRHAHGPLDRGAGTRRARGLAGDRGISPRRARQQWRLRPQHPDDLPSRPLGHGRLLRRRPRRETPRAAGLPAAARRAADELGNRVERRSRWP